MYSFEVLLETCHRLTRNPGRNGLTVRKVAESLGPVILWPPPEPQGTGAAGTVEGLEAAGAWATEEFGAWAGAGEEGRGRMREVEREAVISVFSYLVANFRNPEGYLSN
jgi:hypothetical protein